ncbi:MAG: 3-dehydroquinate synthase [Spirochaetia bacterium]|nr:3-dehydroquinate synthase [Spirochaetia bacterium]
MNLYCTIKGQKTRIEFVSQNELQNELQNHLIITDETVKQLYETLCENAYTVGSGETYKNIGSLQKIIDYFIETHLSRSDKVTALGGGVICDMTAFAAAVYMRGMHHDLVPTTLLSMVDASVGGKTGIDYATYKNLLGAFKPAETVFICTDFLDTIDEGQYYSGFAEIIKHALLTQDGFLQYLMANKDLIISREKSFLEKVIEWSLRIKISFIEQDPYETLGIRQKLNLGHTFGHAYESLSEFTISHGKSVAWGIIKALQIGSFLGYTDERYEKSVTNFFRELGYDVDAQISDLNAFMNTLEHDKKKRGKDIMYVLQKNQGDTFLTPIENKKALQKILTTKN